MILCSVALLSHIRMAQHYNAGNFIRSLSFYLEYSTDFLAVSLTIRLDIRKVKSLSHCFNDTTEINVDENGYPILERHLGVLRPSISSDMALLISFTMMPTEPGKSY